MKLRRMMAVMGIMATTVGACGKSSDKNTDKSPETQKVSEAASQADTQVASEANTETKNYPEITSDKEMKDKDALVIIGDSGYEMYTYNQKSGEEYAKAISDFADKMDGTAKVYDIVIPLGSGIVFPDNKDNSQVKGQQEAMTDIYSKMSDKVNKVNVYDSLMTHRNEYIYFRTDHHWTQLGAYYAYSDLCKAMGAEAPAIDTYETVDFPGFIGSFYNDLKDEALKANPDTITAYRPHAKDTATVVSPGDKDDYSWNIIYDVSDYPAGVKYSTYIGGDNPFTTITNNEKTDGSACVVVKESFGNAFVPFLVDNYQYVYIVDYRYWQGNVGDLVKEKGAKDVIFLNNLSMIRNKYLVGQLQGIIK